MTLVDQAEASGVDDLQADDDISVVAAARQVLPFVCLAAVMALLVRVASLPLGNPDTWFHLRLGDRFLNGWSIFEPGQATQFATLDWIPTQWSMQMLMSVTENWLGLSGVAWLFGTLYLVFFVTLYLVTRRGSGPLPAALASAAAVFGCSASLSARPQAVSLFLLAVTVGAWLQTARDHRARWWLIPLTWVWATAHGYWSIGVVVGFVSWVGIVLDRGIDRRQAGGLIAVPLLSLVAACVTPVGPRLLLSQFAVSERSGLISEWGATSFRSMPALVAATMLALVIVLWVRRSARVRWLPLLLTVLAGALVVYAERLVAVGVVIATPLLAAALDDARPERRGAMSSREVAGVSALAATGALALAAIVPQTATAAANVPAGLSNELRQLPQGTVVLVDSAGTGSWLGWAHPSLQSTVDGMFDAYPLEYLREHRAAVKVDPGWQAFVKSTGAQAAVLRPGGALEVALVDRLGWQELKTADGRTYLVAPSR